MTSLEQVTEHHLIPKSRGGGKNDILKISWVYHKAYHSIFGNLTSKEAQDFLDILFSENQKRWSKDLFYSKQLELQGFEKKNKNFKEDKKLFKVYFKPPERNGLTKNFILIPYYPKVGYYYLFGNLSINEVKIFLKEVFSEKGKKTIWTPDKIFPLRKKIILEKN